LFDYNKAFNAGLSFDSRQQHVSGPVSIHVVEAGDLYIPSGWIVARDPGILPNPDADESPLDRRFPPGPYPVMIRVAKFGQEATEICAMLHISE